MVDTKLPVLLGDWISSNVYMDYFDYECDA